MKFLKKRKARRFEQPSRDDSQEGVGFGYQVPPKLDWVRVYFDQKCCSHLAETFYQQLNEMRWQTVRGKEIRNWKALAGEWIFDHQQAVKVKLKRSRFV